MNTIFYIAKKIYKGKGEDKKVSQPIVKIARLSIIIAMVVNIITLAVVTGFQDKVQSKVIGFGAHATIVKAGETSVFETAPVIYDKNIQKEVEAIQGVASVEPFAYKPALLQSDSDTNYYSINGIDTFQVQQEIHGVVLKGVDSSYDWSFFKNHLLEGRVPNVKDSVSMDEIIVSEQIAQDLGLSIGHKVNIFFVKAQPVKLRYTVTGIFNTGLQEFDNQIIVGDIRDVQKLNDWGVQTSIRVADTTTQDGQFIIYSETRGGNRNYRYNWGKGYTNNYGFTLCPTKDTVIHLIVSDYVNFIDGFGEKTAIPDTAYLKIRVEGSHWNACYPINETPLGEFEKDFLNATGTKFSVSIKGGKKVFFEYIDGKGSQHNYIGGYEIRVKKFDALDATVSKIKSAIYFQDNAHQQHYRVRTIKQDHQPIFLWLDFLNLNVLIILVLMLLIGTINMSSGLLVLIITKTQLIGLLKALGTKNWSIRKLFLYQAFFIIFRGVIIGNIIGIGLCWLQYKWNIVPLNPEVYYLNTVPIELNFWPIFLLNMGTILLCIAALIIPSYVITKITPAKAIKFD